MSAEQLQKFLDDLAARLTPAGQHVFELAVRNQIISALMFIIAGTIAMFIGVVFTAVFVQKARNISKENAGKGHYDRDDPDGYIIGYLCSSGVTIIGLCMILISLPMLLNPEWFALKDILAQLPK